MKADSFLYSDMPLTSAVQAGWFDAPKRPAIFPGVRLRLLPANTRARSDYRPFDAIGYFPGAFGEFHEGHLSVITRAWRELKGRNRAIVIAPAHTSYTVAKYGYTEQATNGYRIRNILVAASRLDFPVYINVDPILNATEDYNFTDQIEPFVNEGTHITVICGKDRNWELLNGLSPYVRVAHYEDRTGVSTSTHHTLKPLVKKHCIIRTDSFWKSYLFQIHFADHYSGFTTVLLEEELRWVEQFRGKAYTNCKDYAHILPYFKVSRKFAHPWDLSPTFENPPTFAGLWVDSDTYSGATRNLLTANGAEFTAYTVCDSQSDVVDISDFESGAYTYPHVDVAERCSMMPWVSNDYSQMAQFLTSLRMRTHVS